MSGPYMPYLLEKGPYLEALEDKLANAGSRRQTLIDLRDQTKHLWNLIGLEDAALDGFGLTPAERRASFRRNWLGIKWRNGAWTKTGEYFWKAWDGDPEAIFRTGLIRAIEVSFGIGNGVGPPALSAFTESRSGPAQPLWPIDLYWICQGPLFQSWILWRQDTATSDGHVSLVFSTPAAEGHPLIIPITRPAIPPPPLAPIAATTGYRANPPIDLAAPGEARGIWVVGHADHVQVQAPNIAGSGERNDETSPAAPLEYRATSTDVVSVRPAAREGGIQ